MPKYKVRSGQNIFDVALTLHGSIQGIFDLLISNDWLNMDTELTVGMELNYHDDYIANPSIALWLNENDIIVKNGEHIYQPFDIHKVITEHIQNNHSEQYDSVCLMSPDEQSLFWDSLCMPRMIIKQQGQLTTLRLQLKPGKHLVIDWGDYTDIQIIENIEEIEIEHCYKGLGQHIITLYGDFNFYLLDLKEINGIYYPLSTIYADDFESDVNIEDLNKLIITK